MKEDAPDRDVGDAAAGLDPKMLVVVADVLDVVDDPAAQDSEAICGDLDPYAACLDEHALAGLGDRDLADSDPLLAGLVVRLWKAPCVAAGQDQPLPRLARGRDQDNALSDRRRCPFA